MTEVSWDSYTGSDDAATDLSDGAVAGTSAEWDDATGAQWDLDASSYLDSAQGNFDGGYVDAGTTDVADAGADAGLAADSYESASDYASEAADDSSAASADLEDS